jgi:hypothetical protein
MTVLINIPILLIDNYFEASMKIEFNIFIYSEKFEDTKGVIRSRRSKKDRQYNDKKKKRQKTK